MQWTGYLDAAGADYSAGGLLLAITDTSARVALEAGFSYLVTASVDAYWCAGSVAAVAGAAVAGSGLLARGAGVVIDAAGGTTHLAAIRAGSTSGTVFLQRRAKR